jgi:hypothetical protein
MTKQRYVLSEAVLGWTAQVVNEDEEFAELPRIIYDASVMAFPNAEREDQWAPIVVLYLSIEGPSPDADVFSAPILRPYAVREQFVKDLVRDAIRSLVATRDAAIAEQDALREDRVADSSG